MSEQFYAIEQWRIKKIRQLQDRLYSERSMSGDEMRDWGNWLWANLNAIEEMGAFTLDDLTRGQQP